MILFFSHVPLDLDHTWCCNLSALIVKGNFSGKRPFVCQWKLLTHIICFLVSHRFDSLYNMIEEQDLDPWCSQQTSLAIGYMRRAGLSPNVFTFMIYMDGCALTWYKNPRSHPVVASVDRFYCTHASDFPFPLRIAFGLIGNQGSILCNVERYEAYFIVSSSPKQPNWTTLLYMSQIYYKVYISILLLVINNSLYSLICVMSIAGRGAFLIILKCSAYLYVVDSQFRWYLYFKEWVKMGNKHNQASFHLKCTNSL